MGSLHEPLKESTREVEFTGGPWRTLLALRHVVKIEIDNQAHIRDSRETLRLVCFA